MRVLYEPLPLETRHSQFEPPPILTFSENMTEEDKIKALVDYEEKAALTLKNEHITQRKHDYTVMAAASPFRTVGQPVDF